MPKTAMAAQPSRAAGARLHAIAGLLPGAAVLLLIYAVPMALLVIDSLSDAGTLSTVNYQRLLGSTVFAGIVWRTLLTSCLVTLGCLVLGYPLAYWMLRLPQGAARCCLFVVTLPFLTSVLIRSYAWVVILGNNGIVNQLLLGTGLTEQPVRLVYNSLGTVIAMVQIQLPLMVLPIYSVMSKIDPALTRAASNLGADPAVAFWTVFRPLSAAGAAAGCCLVFITSLGFYVTPALLGGPGEYLVVQSIEARVAAVVDFGAAAAQASLLLLAVLVLLAVFRRSLGLSLDAPMSNGEVGTTASATPGLRARAVRRLAESLERWAPWATAIRRPALAAVSLLTLLLLSAPMLVVVPLAFSDAPYLTFPPPSYSFRWFRDFLADRAWLSATYFSISIALVSGLVATTLGFSAALALARSRPGFATAIYLAYASPLIIPHMVFAIAFYFLVAPLGLVGNPTTFILAYTVLGLPFALVVLSAAMRRFDWSLEHAASSLGASPAGVLRTVTLPLLRPALVSAFLFAFLAAFDDVVVGLFLSSPSAVTLPIRMWEDVRNEISPKIAAVAVIFLVAILLVYVLGPAMTYARRRRRSMGTVASDL